MGFRMMSFKQSMQLVLLRVGDAGFVEDGDELVFGDRLHDGFSFG